MTFVKVAGVNDLSDGESKVVEAEGKTLALFRQQGKFFAIDNTCPHKQGPLGEGQIEDNIVSCPWHQWKFDIATGVSPVNPAAKVARFEVKVEGEDVLVDV